MKFFKKLNTKGFSHIEMLIVAVVLVAIVGVGAVVYSHHNKAHAGGWTQVGSGQWGTNYSNSYTSYACLSNSSLGTFVRGMVITSTAVPSNSFSIIQDGTTPGGSNRFWRPDAPTQWLYGTINETPYSVVNLNQVNYISVYLGGNTVGRGTSLGLRALQLAAC